MSDTRNVDEHEERNVVVECYVNDEEAIKNVTKRGNIVHEWPPVDDLVHDELSLPSSKVVSILNVPFGVCFLFLERLDGDLFVRFSQF